MKDVDSRPLSEIQFAQDLPEDQREAAIVRIQNFFLRCGCATAQDIQEGSCQNNLWRMTAKEYTSEVAYVRELRFVRMHMAGAGFGLTCNAPGYCLIHDCIGEGTDLEVGVKDITWRDLTADELKQTQNTAYLQHKLAAKENPLAGESAPVSVEKSTTIPRGRKHPRVLAMQLLEAAMALLEDKDAW